MTTIAKLREFGKALRAVGPCPIHEWEDQETGQKFALNFEEADALKLLALYEPVKRTYEGPTAEPDCGCDHCRIRTALHALESEG